VSAAPGPPVHLRTAGPLYERELAALEDATRLALLWEHALRASFDLGRAAGYQAGWLAGRDEEAIAWQAIVTGYSALIDQPTRDGLARRRRPIDDPCQVRCGRCSRCIRAQAVASNLSRYGRPDFPGLPHVHSRAEAS
jgi:hypothetical protein